MIKEGCILPFIETPSEAKFSNNKFALTNSAFVLETIDDTLLSGTIKQVKTPPEVINSLSVSVNFCFHVEEMILRSNKGKISQTKQVKLVNSHWLKL